MTEGVRVHRRTAWSGSGHHVRYFALFQRRPFPPRTGDERRRELTTRWDGPVRRVGPPSIRRVSPHGGSPVGSGLGSWSWDRSRCSLRRDAYVPNIRCRARGQHCVRSASVPCLSRRLGRPNRRPPCCGGSTPRPGHVVAEQPVSGSRATTSSASPAVRSSDETSPNTAIAGAFGVVAGLGYATQLFALSRISPPDPAILMLIGQTVSIIPLVVLLYCRSQRLLPIGGGASLSKAAIVGGLAALRSEEHTSRRKGA